MDLDADLRAYYDAEARDGRRSGHSGFRVGLRERYATTLHAEGRRRVVDVGAGPGIDTAGWVADGFAAVGIDLAFENCRVAARRGLAAITASLYAIPVADATFDALWTMSTFVHVPLDRKDEALAEMIRTVAPGGPLGIGTWGGKDFDGVHEFGELRPFRFFSLMSHDRWRTVLAGHGDVERFETFADTRSDWEYQFAVLRARA